MAKKWTHDAIAVTGNYTDTKGEEKTRWINCGRVFQDENSDGKKFSYEFPLTFNPQGIPHDPKENVVYIQFVPHKSVSK